MKLKTRMLYILDRNPIQVNHTAGVFKRALNQLVKSGAAYRKNNTYHKRGVIN